MKCQEELLARELFAELQARFAGSANPPQIACGGAGVHWDCTVQQGKYRAITHCFSYGGREAEYLTSFQFEDAVLRRSQQAELRIRCRSATIAALADWMQHLSLPELYARHVAVDFSKRAAAACYDEFKLAAPLLANAEHCQLREDQLRFRNGERTASIGFPQPGVGLATRSRATTYFVKLAWDRCELLTWGTNEPRPLLRLLERWILDQALPSQLEREFSGVEFNALAKHYENGNPIEGEFFESWNQVQAFYAELLARMSDTLSFTPAVLALLAELRFRGFDQRLRAGQSMTSLIVSRSRRHGLRHNQPFICFSFAGEQMEVTARLAGNEEQTETYPAIALKAAIVQRLLELAALPIT